MNIYTIIILAIVGSILILGLIGFILNIRKISGGFKEFLIDIRYMNKLILIFGLCSICCTGLCSGGYLIWIPYKAQVEYEKAQRRRMDRKIREDDIKQHIEEKELEHQEFLEKKLVGYTFDDSEKSMPTIPSDKEFIIDNEAILTIKNLIGSTEKVGLKWLSIISLIPIEKVADIVLDYLKLEIQDDFVINKPKSE